MKFQLSFVHVQIGAVFTVCAIAAGLAGWVHSGKALIIDQAGSVRIQLEAAKQKSVGSELTFMPTSDKVEIVGPPVKFVNGRAVSSTEYVLKSRGFQYKLIGIDRMYLEK